MPTLICISCLGIFWSALGFDFFDLHIVALLDFSPVLSRNLNMKPVSVKLRDLSDECFFLCCLISGLFVPCGLMWNILIFKDLCSWEDMMVL